MINSSFHHAMAPCLRMFAWNACSVKLKSLELSAAISTYKLDMILISETWLRPGDRFRLPNFVVHRSDRLIGRCGGTALAVRKSIRHTRIHLPDLVSLEATAIEVELGGMGTVRIVSVYAPPSRPFSMED